MATEAIKVYEEQLSWLGSSDAYETRYEEIQWVSSEEVSNLLALPWIKVTDNIPWLKGKVIVLLWYEAELLRQRIAHKVANEITPNAMEVAA